MHQIDGLDIESEIMAEISSRIKTEIEREVDESMIDAFGGIASQASSSASAVTWRNTFNGLMSPSTPILPRATTALFIQDSRIVAAIPCGSEPLPSEESVFNILKTIKNQALEDYSGVMYGSRRSDNKSIMKSFTSRGDIEEVDTVVLYGMLVPRTVLEQIESGSLGLDAFKHNIYNRLRLLEGDTREIVLDMMEEVDRRPMPVVAQPSLTIDSNFYSPYMSHNLYRREYLKNSLGFV